MIVVPSAGKPQRQPCTVMPPLVAATAVVAFTIGTSVRVFVVFVIPPPILAKLAKIVILPRASTVPEVTDLVAAIVQAAGNVVAAIVAGDV